MKIQYLDTILRIFLIVAFLRFRLPPPQATSTRLNAINKTVLFIIVFDL